MVSYRTATAFERKFGRRELALKDSDQIPTKTGLDGAPFWDTKSYLEYQGTKFLERGFDAVTYVRLTEEMDSHDVGRDRGGVEAALRSLQIPVTIVGIDSD